MLERVSTDKESTVDMTLLFESYRLETLDRGKDAEKDRRAFVTLFIALFPEAKRRKLRKGVTVYNVYEGVKLKPLSSLIDQSETNMDFNDICKILPEDFKVEKSSPSSLRCKYITHFESNGEPVSIEIVFQDSLDYSVIIKGKTVDLKSIGIESKYKISRKGINLICTIVKKLKLCQGIELKYSVKCTRFHVIEQWKTDDAKTTTRIIKSILCTKILQFTSKSDACLTCRKMTINTDIKTESKDQPPDVKSTLRRIIPGASNEMIEILSSQAKNANLNPKQRRWPQALISKCLELYSKSSHFYRQLYSSNIVIIPSPEILILYKNKVKHSPGFIDDIFR